MRTMWICVAAMVLAGCGGGAGTEVTDQGHALSPKSALVASTTGDKPSTTLVVYDQAGLCDTISAVDPCSDYNGPDGTGLVFGIENKGATPNTIQAGQVIPIGDKADGGWAANGAFEVVSSGQNIFNDDLVSGSITFAAFSPNGAASGSYDVTTKGGAALQGDFAADFCQGLFSLITADKRCDSSGGGASCSASCTCSVNNEQVSAACTTQLDGSSSCTCTDKSGTTTTCTVPAGSGNACSTQSGCCNLKF